jgi:Dit-like tail protein
MSEAIADSLFSWLDAAGNTNTLDVDVVMSTADKRTARLTDHVVETGAVVTDHIVIQPETLSFELLVTQTPHGGKGQSRGFSLQATEITVDSMSLNSVTVPIQVPKSRFKPGGFFLLSQGLRSIVEDALGLGADIPTKVKGSASRLSSRTMNVATLKADTEVDRVNVAHDTLVGIMNTGLLVTVSFKGRLYLDYLLTSVELSQGKGESGCGRFKVEVRAFRTVKGTNVALPDPTDFRALPKVSKGNTPTKTPDPDPTKRGKTIFARTTDAVNNSDFAARAGKALGL